MPIEFIPADPHGDGDPSLPGPVLLGTVTGQITQDDLDAAKDAPPELYPVSFQLEMLQITPEMVEPEVSLFQIFRRLEKSGLGMLMVLFALPLALPSGIMPGLNILFALPLVPLMAQQALGYQRAWLPAKIMHKQFKTAPLSALITKIIPRLQKLEKLLKPRLNSVIYGVPGRLLGACGVLMAAFASIPVPLTHTVPGIGLLLMAVGITMHDGLAVIIGVLVGIIYIAALLTAIAIFGPHAVEIIRHMLKST